MADEPDIFSVPNEINVQTFAAMAKAVGLGSTVVVQSVAGQTGDLSAESLAVVHTSDLSRMLRKYLGKVGAGAGGFVLPKYIRAPDVLNIVGAGADEFVLPKVLKPSRSHPREDFQLLVFDSSRGTVDTVPGADVGDFETRILDVLRTILPESEATKATARDLLRNKAVAGLVKLIDQADEQTALEALSAPDDLSALIWFLASPGVTSILTQSTQPLAASLMRGVERRRQLLAMEEGTASGQEFAEALGISRQAVDKRRRAGDLLAVPNGSGDWRYPWWQLQEGKVLPNFEKVMTALGELSPWARMDFLLSPDERLGGRRPLDALRKGEIDAVLQSARAEGEQGAL
jgi:hypothetical protein